MSLNYANNRISEEDYLQGELIAEFKHEFIDGEVYAMAGASENHNLLSGNLFAELKGQLKGTPCRTFIADMKVKVGDDFFYPDVMVVCDKNNDSEYYKQSPVIIVEVLSPSTRKFDKNAKRLKYQAIPTLEEYVLIDQTIAEIEVFRRKEHWQSFYYYLGDTITFESLGLTLLVEDIYYQVDNDDVMAFLQEKAQAPVQSS
ncbi:MAG: Uma2 family endonuclease [Methylobacter sp.]|nr:Uma2 family endonuclease [Methylobacter sp.]MDP2098530.1 Uma2 family endonuclease [Methylobacter sp.]MDP2428239.1 Uma2 family endonuclease [Methylobacter sp.]MDP3053752.1 Uma2 family endonuclease [Methylobacter sp.]MDP3363973.1 Uma2 family endonuclease [Methylobacter sp.]